MSKERQAAEDVAEVDSLEEVVAAEDEVTYNTTKGNQLKIKEAIRMVCNVTTANGLGM